MLLAIQMYGVFELRNIIMFTGGGIFETTVDVKCHVDDDAVLQFKIKEDANIDIEAVHFVW